MRVNIAEFPWDYVYVLDTPTVFRAKHTCSATHSLCLNSSQYAITFSQSSINADFFYFWGRSWYSGRCGRRLNYILYLGCLGFVWFLSSAERKVSSLEFHWKRLLHLLLWKNLIILKIKFKIRKGLYIFPKITRTQ